MLSRKHEINLHDRISIIEWAAATWLVAAWDYLVTALEKCSDLACYATVFDLQALLTIFLTSAMWALVLTLRRSITDYKKLAKKK